MYHTIITRQKDILTKLTRQKGILSWIRLILLLAVVYFFYLMMYQKNEQYGIVGGVLFVLFLLSVTIYLKIQAKVKYHQTLKKINEEEVAFLEGKHKFEAGAEFQNPQHAFSYDLDLFGANSIFQFINRTGTWLGKQKLADDLQHIPTAETILLRQEAVQELKEKLVFRQHFQALAHLAGTTEKEDLAIKHWTASDEGSSNAVFNLFAVVFPLLFLICFIGLVFDLHPVFGKLTTFFFTLNLATVGLFTKNILKEIGTSDKIANSLQQYAKMIQTFEETDFQSGLLKNIQERLRVDAKNSNEALRQLANYFEKLNTIANLFVFVVFNGVFQYHFWVYKKLLLWKKDHQKDVWKWIQIIGEVEALNSLANFAYNNPAYRYPEIASHGKNIFKELGHPLIDEKKRVRNSIDFSERQFVILTGSNMSGKSTFLRTVGINLVLGYAGVPIDCSEAEITPSPLWVSMRLTDSLSDSESFFFAEVKRLKQIVEEAVKQPVFVLLDEILKGTNSDDKKTGTVGVIEKLHYLNVSGMIATHDLEVCETTAKYPDSMGNKRFEVEIINNDLHFDYQLKDGICQNKNATFIMKKMEII